MAPGSKRASPPTHPTVWVGLGLAAVGLVLAVYAYTGTRVYDITYAVVALVGGILALSGILTAAWGRAVMTARASRSRRHTIERDALRIAEGSAPAPPTIAEPAAKKRLALIVPRKLFGKREEAAPPETAAGKAAIFAFKPKSGTAGAPPAPLAADPQPALKERLTLQCPQCAAKFVAEGARPLQATCPHCAFSATVA